uniref:Uncharacterized protein n=1 Tax=Megaselia scalaris TaxID=36166 RepID=T1GQV3_MEGSC
MSLKSVFGERATAYMLVTSSLKIELNGTYLYRPPLRMQTRQLAEISRFRFQIVLRGGIG